MFSVVSSKHLHTAQNYKSEYMNNYETEDWKVFEHRENNDNNDTKKEVIKQKKYPYLTYLKLLRDLSAKTALSEEVGGMVGEGEIIFPSSHSLTQTDREYFNIVRTEDGQSMFAREQDREIHHNKREEEGEGNKKEKKWKRK